MWILDAFKEHPIASLATTAVALGGIAYAIGYTIGGGKADASVKVQWNASDMLLMSKCASAGSDTAIEVLKKLCPGDADEIDSYRHQDGLPDTYVIKACLKILKDGGCIKPVINRETEDSVEFSFEKVG